MLRKGLIFLSNSPTAKKLLTDTPFTRAMSKQFVPGETVDSAIEATREDNALGLKVTMNYLGESVEDEPSARAAADTYIQVLEEIGTHQLDANVSLKFTQMGQDISESFLTENLGRVLEVAERHGIFLRFDMEYSSHTQRTLDALEKLWAQGHQNIGTVLQAYLFRTEGDVARMIQLGARVRLCKGAYSEPPSIAIQEMDKIRENYVHLMKRLLSEGNYPGLATHDPKLIEAAVDYVAQNGIGSERFEFQMLHGVRTDLQKQLVADGYNVRVYIPFGEMWYPYLMRRMAERPANILMISRAAIGRAFGRG